MFTNKKWATIVTLAVVIATILVACAPAPTPTPGPTPTPVVITKEVTKEVPKEVTKVVVVTPTPAPPSAAALARAQTLNVALGGRIADPTNLNLYAPGVSRSGTGLHQMIYEYFFYDNLQTGEYIPWLAEKYEYSKDFTSITVYLRKGVTWSDGKPFTADDVVFTYQLLATNTKMTWASEANKWAKSVEKINDLTVKINLTSANPRYHLNREAFPAVGIWGGLTILPKHVWEGKDPLTFKNSPPVGTGAYKLVNATTTSMTYERRDDWWGIKVFGVTPAPKTVNFMYVGDETSTALALAANELDTPNIGILTVGSYKRSSSGTRTCGPGTKMPPMPGWIPARGP